MCIRMAIGGQRTANPSGRPKKPDMNQITTGPCPAFDYPAAAPLATDDIAVAPGLAVVAVTA